MPAYVTAIKSVRQPFLPSSEIFRLMGTFRQMVNDCIRIGLEHDVSATQQLCRLAYRELARHDIISYYKLGAISHAAGILANRKKSIKRGLKPKRPFAARPLLLTCYGFKIVNGTLRIALGSKRYFDLSLNSHVLNVLSHDSFRIRSFTLTIDSLSICYSKEIQELKCTKVDGIDRNLRNLTAGNRYSTIQYDISKAVDIAENTRSIQRSIKRNNVRIRRKLYQKYGLRKKYRRNQLLNRLTKAIVLHAKQNKSAIAFEDIRHIRRLYQKGNYQRHNYRNRLNSWSFSEVKHQIEYKAKWEGIPVIQLTKGETRGTSQLCPQCGKRITQVDRKFRQLWCAECKKWMDRDVVAAMNISIKGLQRFCSSKGLAGEAMRGNPTTPVILRVDASKLAFRRRDLKCRQNPTQLYSISEANADVPR